MLIALLLACTTVADTADTAADYTEPEPPTAIDYVCTTGQPWHISASGDVDGAEVVWYTVVGIEVARATLDGCAGTSTAPCEWATTGVLTMPDGTCYAAWGSDVTLPTGAEACAPIGLGGAVCL
jgi:hypothetical protein